MELFNSQDVSSYIAGKTTELKNDINKISDNDMQTISIEDFVDYYYDKYYINPICILRDNIESNIEKTKIEEYNPWYDHGPLMSESKTIFIDGFKVNYNIPFEGESSLLFLRPTMRILYNFQIDDIVNRYSEKYLPSIIFSIKIKNNQLEQSSEPQKVIEDTFKKEFEKYERMINNVNSSINAYNNSLKSKITELLKNKKKQSDNFTTLMSKINIPLKTNVNSSNTTPITLSVKKEQKKYPENKNANQKEYSIANEDYNNITNIIKLACISFERTAKAFNKFDEEELRDFLLANLNTHYNSLATGETFSKNGKTDIKIQFENKAAYIAECKIWHGISEFKKAIIQLFSYTTWRDCKTSLIVFNKENKDFKSILDKINNDLSNDEMCINCKKVEANNWQCIFKKNIDSNEKIELNIIICDISL